MSTSKKYQYNRLSLSTAMHSLKVTFKVLIRRPEALLAFILLFAIDEISFLIYFVSPLILIYAYCKSGVIEENFSESWAKYKIFLLVISTLFAFIYLIVSFLESGSGTPVIEENTDPSLFFTIIFFSFAILVFTLVNIYISLTMILHSAEMYDEYRGEGQIRSELLGDHKMLILILIASIAMSYIGLLLLYSIVICHIYTPDLPKKKESLVTSYV